MGAEGMDGKRGQGKKERDLILTNPLGWVTKRWVSGRRPSVYPAQGLRGRSNQKNHKRKESG